MISRRTVLVLGGALTSALALPLSAIAVVDPARATFDQFRRLDMGIHLMLIRSYYKFYNADMGQAMWLAKFSQYYVSVVPVAIERGAANFGEIRAAFDPAFILVGAADDTVPSYQRFQMRSAASIFFGYDEDLGLEQKAVWFEQQAFIGKHMRRMLDHLEAAYDGSAADMSAGRFDWTKS